MAKRQVWYEVAQDLANVALGRQLADFVIKTAVGSTLPPRRQHDCS